MYPTTDPALSGLSGRSRTRRGAAALGCLSLVLLVTGTAAAAPSRAHDRELGPASRAPHRLVADGPQVEPGQVLIATASGFAPGTRVQVGLQDAPTVMAGQVRADTHGTARFVLRVPERLTAGRHTLSITGPLPGAASMREPEQTAAPAPALAPARSDQGSETITVTIPRVSLYGFTVRPR